MQRQPFIVVNGGVALRVHGSSLEGVACRYAAEHASTSGCYMKGRSLGTLRYLCCSDGQTSFEVWAFDDWIGSQRIRYLAPAALPPTK